MNRRTFLQSLAAAIGLGPTVAKAVPTEAIKPLCPDLIVPTDRPIWSQMPMTKSQVAAEIDVQCKRLRRTIERCLLSDLERANKP